MQLFASVDRTVRTAIMRAAAAPLALCVSVTAAVAQQGPPVVTVSPPLVQELIEYQEFTGQFRAVDQVEVRARVSGYLDEVLFEEGTEVGLDDMLFVIDQRPFLLRLQTAQAQVAQAQAQLDFAEGQLERAEQLLDNGNIPRATYDERLEARNVALQAVEVAMTEVATAELDLEFTEVRAPIAGRVSDRYVSVGNLVVGGSSGTATELTTIVATDPIYFEFDMSERYFIQYQRAIQDGILPAREDLPVNAHLFDEPGSWPYEGTLDFVDNRIDQTSGTIRMRAVFPNPDEFLTPGQFGVLRMPASPLYEAILLPDAAILTDQDQRIVFTIDENNIVVPKVVRPGPRELGLRLIREGLSPDDRVIIDGIVRVRPGIEVEPMPGEIVPPVGG